MPTELQSILKLSVPVIVRVGEHYLPLDDVLSLGPGAIVEMSKHSDEELDLMVNNKCIGRGVAVKVGENFGIRITSIGTPLDRVKAMGG